MRIFNGIPLFFEEHYSRLLKSAELTKISIEYDQSELLELISILIKENDLYSGNIRIIINHYETKNKLALSFIKHKYPSERELQSGVFAHSVKAYRINPNAKTLNINLRNLLDSIIIKKNIYETIMVNKGNITEGSRSNIFFIKNNCLHTSPQSTILPGITRQKIIDICNNLDINIMYKNIPLKDLRTFEAAFITGTSSGVLQLSQIDKIKLQLNHAIILKISKHYNALVKENLNFYSE
ncbi:aminotransferase class IV [Bacteroidota bacterium]